MQSIRYLAAAAVLLPSMVLAGVTTRPAEANVGLRLDGTFIQYQPWMMKMDRAAWHKELEAMYAAGLRTVVIQWLQSDRVSYLPGSDSEPDPTAAILNFADEHGMEVWLGLAMDRRWWQEIESDAFLDELSAKCRQTADRAGARYGRHASFRGWYIPPEPSDAPYTAVQVARLRKFLGDIARHCKAISNDKLVGFAPFLTGEHEPERVEQCYAQMLADSGVDVLMLQDGVGARGWDDCVHSRVNPLFRAIRNACLTNGVEMWSDIEVFRNTSKDPAKPSFTPADVKRLGKQLAAEAPYVTRFVAFDFFHYMSPYRSEQTERFHDDYVREFVSRPFYPVFGQSAIVDPSFGYYRDRSRESVASEIRANGYCIVRLIAEPSARVDRALVDAFHAEKIGVWLQVFGNGSYSKQLLPPEYKKWAMVTRTDLTGGKLEGFQRLCLNNREYRAWKKKDIANALRSARFDGIEIAEPYWPDYPGIESPAYGCFCETCRLAFTLMFPEESQLPDIVHPESSRSPGKNPELWKKWLQFRQASETDFLNDMVNGPGGLRATSPGVKIAVWNLALAQPNGVQLVREHQGQDPAEIASRVKPDLYCFQTHWPDWIRADLKPDYVKDYVPFIEQLRKGSPDMPVMIQTDVGSTREAVRDRSWVEQFEKACEQVGAESTCLYEYFIAGWTYHEPARVTQVRRKGDQIELVLTRRIDPAAARQPGAIRIEGHDAEVIRVDGNLLAVASSGDATTTSRIEIRGLREDAGRNLFADLRPVQATDQTLRVGPYSRPDPLGCPIRGQCDKFVDKISCIWATVVHNSSKA